MKGLRCGRGVFFVLMLALGGAARQDQESPVKPFAVTARKYAFAPQRIEVFQDDLVRIELTTEDIAHSFTIDVYRIAKRVNPGHPTSFEFRADRVGTFPFYCNLKIDDGCRQMRGELIVKPRRQAHLASSSARVFDHRGRGGLTWGPSVLEKSVCSVL